jgi:PEP-CTERM motif
MKLNLSKIAVSLAVGLLLPIAAHAAPVISPTQVCPIITGGAGAGNEGENPTYLADELGQANEGCNILITFNANGSITTSYPNAAISYDDGDDDVLVGVVNDTNAPLTSLALSSSLDIFGFDDDGPCGTVGGAFTTGASGQPALGYTYSASGAGGTDPCANSVESPNTSIEGNNPTENDYAGPFVTYSNIVITNPTNCENDVTPCTETGDVNFGDGGIAADGSSWFGLESPVDVNLTVAPGNTPEPGSLFLLGTGVLGMAGMLRRRIVNAAR